MNAILHTYESLLADVARLSRHSEIRGSVVDLHWCLNEAPLLEKRLINAVENGSDPELDAFPSQLRAIARESLVDPLQMRLLRQLLLFANKAYVQHDNKTTIAAFDAFVKTNHQVGYFGQNLFNSQIPVLFDLARKHCQSALYMFRGEAIKPSHGPGATTTPKGLFRAWYSCIEAVYPYSDYCSLYFNRDGCEAWADSVVEDADIVCKLIAVPKDSRGPRLICVHPSESIWIQQGVRRELERAISLHRTCYGPWPQGHVHFRDQAINGRIALLSSLSRKYATLDMKEASDRISDRLVQGLFGSKYKFFGCCRALRYRIPATGFYPGHLDEIHSYAPMGNATTFPVQSLVFWAICCASMQHHGFRQPGAVFVFGDDIIVPSECAEVVCNDLESFGLVVNRTKSFWRGQFRESCGVDAFKGVDVTPVRWKATLNAEHLSGLQSLSDIAMRLRIAGYDEAAAAAYSVLGDRLRFYNGARLSFTNNRDHGGIAEFTTNDYLVWRDAYWHTPYQWYHSPVWSIKEESHKGTLCGWNHVLESVVSLDITGRSNVPDRSAFPRTRLARSGIPVL